MKTPLVVFVEPEAAASGAVDSVIASMPASLVRGQNQGSLHAIAGEPGWTLRTLTSLTENTRGLLVVQPCFEDLTHLIEATKKHGTPVVLDLRWESNAAVALARKIIDEAIDTFTVPVMVDSVAMASTASDLSAVLREHLALLCSVVGSPESLDVVNHGPRGYTLQGQLACGAPLAIQGILSNSVAPSCRLEWLTVDGGVSLFVPDPDTAIPAKVTQCNPCGTTTFPSIYESAHRTSWRRLNDALGTTLPTDVHDFAQLTTLIKQFHQSYPTLFH